MDDTSKPVTTSTWNLSVHVFLGVFVKPSKKEVPTLSNWNIQVILVWFQWLSLGVCDELLDILYIAWWMYDDIWLPCKGLIEPTCEYRIRTSRILDIQKDLLRCHLGSPQSWKTPLTSTDLFIEQKNHNKVQSFVGKTNPSLVGGWATNMLVKLEIFPNFRGENKKIFETTT